jgi:hypothetical protein
MGIDEKIMLKWIIQVGWEGMYSFSLEYRPVAGFCEHGNESFSSVS